MSAPRKSSVLLSARHKRAIALSVLLAGLLYLVAIEYVGREAVFNALGKLSWPLWLFILGCSLANYSLRFLRWHLYVRQFGVHIPAARHLVYYLAGFALTTTPGKAGEITRSVFLRPHGLPYRRSLACFFVERFMDVLVVAGLSVLTLLAVDRHASLIVLYTLIIVGLVPIIRSRMLRRLLHLGAKGLRRRPRLRRLTHHLIDLLAGARTLLRGRWLVLGLALGIPAWLIQGVAFNAIATALEFSPGFALLIGVYAISLLAGAASFIPGGLGTTEAAMVTLLIALGADAQTAWAIAITSRVSTLWFAVGLGLSANTLISLQHAPAGAQRSREAS